ncbi:MAG: acyl-CoA thioesterase [Ruminococcus sp.]|nr:acyl-CoA thioesterase [Ruminococcus sp.]
MKPYERKVYYYETDKMGIMHHSNYIRIFEESRVDFMEKAGMPFEKIEELGLMMPVLSVSCKFLYPLRFDEPFAVYPAVTKFTGVRLEVSYAVKSLVSGKICAEGSSSHCFTNTELKPVSVKKAFPDVYKIFAENINPETNIK